MSLSNLLNRSRFYCCETAVIDALAQLPSDSFVARNGLDAIPDVKTFADQHPDDCFTVNFRLRGGKGGFGTLLRSFRINRSTNQKMCRDLNGRRLADIEEEKKLKKWVENAGDREKKKADKKKSKYEKLKAATQDKPRHDFNDPDYIRQREEILDKTEDAVDAAFEQLRKNKKRKAAKKEPTPETSDDEEMPGPSIKVKRTSSFVYGETTNDKSPSSASEESEDSTDARAAESDVVAAEEEEKTEIKEEVTKEEQVQEQVIVKTPIKEVVKEEIPKEFPPIDLDNISNEDELEALGLHHLKHALEARGLKCGGSLQERIKRLYSVKGMSPDKYPKNILAPKKK